MAAAAAKLLMADMTRQDEPSVGSKAQRSLPPPQMGVNRKALVADMAADAKAMEYIVLMERREREMKEMEEEEARVPAVGQHRSAQGLNEKFNY